MGHRLGRVDQCYQHRDGFVCEDGGNGERVSDLALSFLADDGCGRLDNVRRGSWYDEGDWMGQCWRKLARLSKWQPVLMLGRL